MNTASKTEKILNAWLEYIALDDYSNAKVESSNKEIVKQHGVKLQENHVLIEQAIFSEIKQKITRRKPSQQEAVWVLSFPQVLDVEKGKSSLCPLFSLDVTSIFQGEYQEQGWNLDFLTLIEAGENLATFLDLDDEQREQLITQDGLRPFLETTFGIEFQTYEQWMQRVRIPSRSRRKIERRPYLFEFTGPIYSKNLKKDLKEIKSGLKNWSQGHPAYEYLFGVPQPPEHEVIYMGAFPTYAPTNSQLTALKHAQTEALTAVQGPPGSGKTTLILHVIAQQVVNRALKLIESEENYNNLTVVSSTNNKAVENVIEKLDEWLTVQSLEHNFLYLKGGKKDNIQSSGGAVEQLQSACNYLQKNYFDESHYNDLKQIIKQIKNDFLSEESKYLEQRHQRALDEEWLPQLQNRIQTLQQDLDEIVAARTNFQQRAVDLVEYEQLPIKDYKHLKVIFDTAEMQLPTGTIYWWKKILLWLTGRTERQILRKTAQDCQSAILNTVSTIFSVEVPRTRSELVQEGRLVRERLNKAEELESVQARLQEISENIEITEKEKNKDSEELSALENRLANPHSAFA